MIESPFSVGEDSFVSDFQRLLEKYGYHHYFLLYAEPDSNGKAHWYGAFDEPTDGLLDILEETVDSFKEDFGV